MISNWCIGRCTHPIRFIAMITPGITLGIQLLSTILWAFWKQNIFFCDSKVKIQLMIRLSSHVICPHPIGRTNSWVKYQFLFRRFITIQCRYQFFRKWKLALYLHWRIDSHKPYIHCQFRINLWLEFTICHNRFMPWIVIKFMGDLFSWMCTLSTV